MLAHFIDTVLLPLVDVSVDVHTAGHSMEWRIDEHALRGGCAVA